MRRWRTISRQIRSPTCCAYLERRCETYPSRALLRAAVRGWLFEPDAIVAIVTAREFGEHLTAWIRSSLDRYQKCPLHSKQKRPFLGFWGKFFFYFDCNPTVCIQTACHPNDTVTVPDTRYSSMHSPAAWKFRPASTRPVIIAPNRTNLRGFHAV